MDFKFNRQTSKDFLFKKSESFKSSLTSGASDVKNGLFGGLTQVQSKLDNLSTRISSSLDDASSDEDYLEEKQRLLSEQARQAQARERVRRQSAGSASNNQSEHDLASLQNNPKPVKQKPPKPPLPKQLSRGSIDQNGSVRALSANEPNQQTKKRIPAPSKQELGFNEQTSFDSDGLEDVNVQNGAYNKTASNGQGYEKRNGQKNPFTDITNEAESVFADIHSLENSTRDLDIAISEPPKVPDLMQRRRTNPFIDSYDKCEEEISQAPINTTTSKTAKATPPQQNNSNSLNTDLLPGIPRVPSKNNTDLLIPAQPSADLLAITPTSGAALPIPLPPSHAMESDSREIYDDSDADSVATEGCDEEPEVYDEMEEAEMLRSGSGTSDASWNSSDSHLDAQSRECMMFMREFTNKIFDHRLSISPVDKSKFGQMCQHESGRLWFSRFIHSQSAEHEQVSEHSFFQLVQYFAIVLFECNEQEHYKPAKTLMTLCFHFYHQAEHPTGPPHKHYLYSYLKDQPVWQSLKFWNAACFDAIMAERCKPVPKEAIKSGDDREYQRSLTFNQLGKYTTCMRSFGLAKELCYEFLRKQSVVANLTEGQTKMLKENIEKT